MHRLMPEGLSCIIHIPNGEEYKRMLICPDCNGSQFTAGCLMFHVYKVKLDTYVSLVKCVSNFILLQDITL